MVLIDQASAVCNSVCTMPSTYSVIGKENIASVRDIQRNPSQALRGLTRVMRGSQTMGFYFSQDLFDELLEDIEAAGSQRLKKRAKEARAGKGKTHMLDEVARRYGV